MATVVMTALSKLRSIFRHGCEAGDERGASLIELAMILPFLVFLLFVAVDVAMYLQSYLRANHVLREGLRAAAVTPGLIAGTTSVNGSTAGIPPSGRQGHIDIQRRINNLLHAESFNTSTNTFGGGIAGLNMDSAAAVGSVEQNVNVTTYRDNADRVEVDLDGKYLTLFGRALGANEFELRYTVRGFAPYLFQ